MSFQEFKAKDIELDGNFDLVIKDGDLSTELSDDQHVNLIIVSAKGNFRFAPTVGVDILSFLNSTGKADLLRRNVQEQLVLDGYRVDSIDFEEQNSKLDKINIKAKRIR